VAKNKQNQSLSIEEQLAQLEAQRAALLEQKQNAERQRNENIANAVKDFIPTLRELGANIADGDFKSLVATIRHVENGTLGKVGESGTRKARVELSDEDKQKVVADFKAGMQVSQVSEKWNISSATAWGIKKAAGLVVARDAAPAAAAAS
jgi:hypothetical protein